MQHGLKNRRMKKTVQADAPRAATGPATVSEKSWMSDQARLGLDTGEAHVPVSMQPRSSITDGTADSVIASRTGLPGAGRASIPPLQYTQTPVSTAANGTLSFAEERRLQLYKQEQEAIESGTSIRGASNTYTQESDLRRTAGDSRPVAGDSDRAIACEGRSSRSRHPAPNGSRISRGIRAKPQRF